MDDSLSRPVGESNPLDVEERPTLKTIARLAGLAVPTVSRALNDAPDIGEDTKRRVREIAQRIGYRPNRAGVRLRTGKTNVISLVLSTEHDVMNHTARLISSIAGELRGTPYHMIVTPFFPTEDPMDPIRYIVESGSADGVIMNQIEPRDPRVAYLIERNFPFATHGRTEWMHPYADFDNRTYAEIAVAMMARRGRRRIALLRPTFSHAYSIHLYQGASDACQRLGLELLVVEGATSDDPSGHVERVMPRYLAGPDRCDGFILPAAAATMATVTAAEHLGLVVGRDIDIAAKEAVPFLRRFRKEILTLREDVNSAGSFLAQALMARIARPKDPPMQRLDVPTLDDPAIAEMLAAAAP
jgi:LacI family transcriptional regulator